jgi:hypothetical protein
MDQGTWLSPTKHCLFHPPCEEGSDQVLITRPDSGNSLLRLGVSICHLEVTRASVPHTFPPFGEFSEYSYSHSLHPHHPCTAPVPKLPVPLTLRTVSAIRAPEQARKSTSTGMSTPRCSPSCQGQRELRSGIRIGNWTLEGTASRATGLTTESPEAPGQLPCLSTTPFSCHCHLHITDGLGCPSISMSLRN